MHHTFKVSVPGIGDISIYATSKYHACDIAPIQSEYFAKRVHYRKVSRK